MKHEGEALVRGTDRWLAEDAALNQSPSEAIIVFRLLKSEEITDMVKSFL